MSIFYLTPAKGEIPVHVLEVIISKRLEFLKGIFRDELIIYNEYVIEGSVYDNVGHFTLCVLATLSDNRAFSQFILQSETALFKKRLASITAYDLRCVSKKLLRTLKKYEIIHDFLEPLRTLCQRLILKNIAQHITCTHNSDCTWHNIHLNFKHCLSLIARRQVELKYGVATIPCGLWKQFFISMFYANLKHKITLSTLSPLKADSRILGLLAKIKIHLSPFLISGGGDILLSCQVDSASKYFPPCMMNLHQSLRMKHRLSHYQRFYYSLFLKDIGMPVEEAIEFWKKEYQQSPNGKHSCCHNWEKDEKKYLYGIRHTYGLEGGRKNYSALNCQRMQSMRGSCFEGGCPFKTFSSQKLNQLLSLQNNELLWNKINNLNHNNQYTLACVTHMKNLSMENNDCDNGSFNFSPVKFYTFCNKGLK